MAKASKFSILNHGVGFDREIGGTTGWNGGRASSGRGSSGKGSAGSPRTPTMNLSKAERLLGVTDLSGMNAQLPRPGSEAGKRSQRRGKGFTSAFADIKGALAGTRYSVTRNRYTPTSPALAGPTDTDSVTSVTSPTFDTSTTASTLPSHFDAPNSPYFSHRGSESPSSPQDQDARFDYHAALSPERYKAVQDLRYINEQLMRPTEDSIRNQPPLEMPPLSPVAPVQKSDTPKTSVSFAPINRLRSPSTLSVASEVTAKARLFGRRNSKQINTQTYLDYPSTPSTERQAATPTAHIPIPPMPTTKADTAAIEQWLARADLTRRASATSSITRSTMRRRKDVLSVFSATSSSVSEQTATTQKGSSPPPRSPPPPIPHLLRNARSTDELDNFAVARQQPGFRQGKADLSIQSVLSLSSSEDESSDDEHRRKERGGRAKKGEMRFQTLAPPPVKRHSSQSSAASATQVLEMQRQAIIQKRAEKRNGSKRRLPPIITPPLPDINKTAFGSIDWQNTEDEDEVGLDSEDVRNQATGTGKSRPGILKTDSMHLSPTSKVMVVSKKEEKLLAQMREFKQLTRRASATTTETDSTSSAPATPIIAVSPPRRSKRTRASDGVDEMLELSENRVITFPTPPTLPMIGSGRGRSGSMSLSLSREVMSELNSSKLPEVVEGSSDEQRHYNNQHPNHHPHHHPQASPLPTSVSVPTSSAFAAYDLSPISPETQMPSHHRDYFGLGLSSYGAAREVTQAHSTHHELQGSFPDLTSALRADIDRKRERRRPPALFYQTDAEDPAVHADELEDADDIARFVLSSVI